MENEISTTEAAQVLGVTTRRVRQLIEAGELQGRRLNPRLWLVTRESLEAYQAKRSGALPTGKVRAEQ